MKVTPYKYPNGAECWRVTWREAGRAVRKFFQTKEDAGSFATAKLKELKKYGHSWAEIPDLDRFELVECWKRAKDAGYSISGALRFYEQHNPNTALNLGELIERFLEAKERKRIAKESLRILKATIELFAEGREERPASNITPEEVEEFVHNPQWGDWRRRGAIIDLGNLFNWALKKGLVSFSPMAGIERPIIDDKTPEILTVEDAAALLKVCRERYAALLPGIAISLFAGLRSAEVRRLQWEQLRGSFIELKSHQTKGRARRLVSIREALAAWLEGNRREMGSVWPEDWKIARDFRSEVAGLPKNVLRHSFISYALGAGETIDRVAMESGNTPDVIFKHYRELVTPEQAGLFWGLRPD